MNLLRSAARSAGILSLMLLAGLAAPMAQAQAQAWPQKPVRLVVAGAPGGSADLLARLVGDALAKEIGQPVLTEPKPGAGGVIAVTELSQAPRDGHTLLVAVNSLVSEIPHILKTKVDMASEVTPLAELARAGLVLVGHPGVPAKTLPELVAYVKARPGQVNVASYSAGTLSHVLGLQLNQAAGIELVHVGYKGSTPALQDVMGGHVPLMFDGMPSALPLLKAGRIKAFAVSLPQRSPLLPELPTFNELGYPRLEAVAWIGLWAKPDVPPAVQAQIRNAVLKVLAQPAALARLQEIGFDAAPPRSPQALTQALRADFERMGALLKAIQFKPE
ncbi:MAG: tripartite tricarboxylate transporter substrate binding protein [Burkholderiales bacterium]|nr:tripartite tricarboxylate transporter substrate binding protein [Burkholderiales bacterium]